MGPMTKDLSMRETQILRLIAEGKGNREIAEVLGISVRTVEAHRARIMLKLDLESVPSLVRYAVRHGIIEA
jgi:two-component system response regulator NreC